MDIEHNDVESYVDRTDMAATQRQCIPVYVHLYQFIYAHPEVNRIGQFGGDFSLVELHRYYERHHFVKWVFMGSYGNGTANFMR